jgi:hypothetical protein
MSYLGNVREFKIHGISVDVNYVMFYNQQQRELSVSEVVSNILPQTMSTHIEKYT